MIREIVCIEFSVVMDAIATLRSLSLIACFFVLNSTFPTDGRKATRMLEMTVPLAVLALPMRHFHRQVLRDRMCHLVMLLQMFQLKISETKVVLITIAEPNSGNIGLGDINGSLAKYNQTFEEDFNRTYVINKFDHCTIQKVVPKDYEDLF